MLFDTVVREWRAETAEVLPAEPVVIDDPGDPDLSTPEGRVAVGAWLRDAAPLRITCRVDISGTELADKLNDAYHERIMQAVRDVARGQ